MADNINIKDANKNIKTLSTKDLAGVHFPKRITVDSLGNEAFIPESLMINQSNYVSQYLVNGGSNDMGVDGSGAAVTFNFSPGATQKLILGRVIVYLEMGTNFDSTEFGDLSALANGVSITANGTEIENWKDNIDIGATGYDHITGVIFSKSGRSLLLRWTFWKVAGQTQGLEILTANGFSFIIQDNLSAANIIFRAKIQGVLVDI